MDERSPEKETKVHKRNSPYLLAENVKVNNYELRLPELAALGIKKKHGKGKHYLVWQVFQGEEGKENNRISSTILVLIPVADSGFRHFQTPVEHICDNGR